MDCFLLSTGSALGSKFVPNDALPFPPVFCKTIVANTGIESRYHSTDEELTSDLAAKAVLDCLAKVGLEPNDVDGLVLATTTPDRTVPQTAPRVAHKVGMTNTFAFDVNASCCGSQVALEVARSLVVSGTAKRVLAVASETLVKFANPKDFVTYPYFSDAAAAALVSNKRLGGEAIGQLSPSVMHCDGSGYDVITIKAGGSELPAHKLEDKSLGFIKMNGKAVYDFATAAAVSRINELLESQKISKESISKIILHQANVNILNKVADDLGVARDMLFSNIPTHGNTGGASALLALDQHLAESREQRAENNYIIICTFGAGLASGAMAIKLN